MKKKFKCAPFTLLALAVASGAARSQAIPADVGTAPGVGFQLPRVGGTLSYGLNASELISSGFYNTGVNYTTDFSGDLAYVSKSEHHPFSAIYAGGVLIGNSDQPTTTFQELSFSQVLSTKRWNLTAADSVSYIPETPTTGLSGIPGVGDLGVDPVTVGPVSGIGILTTYGPRVSNIASGTASRMITGKISAQANVNYGIERFIGDNSGLALNSATEGGSAGLSYHFNARDTVTGNYSYTRFNYSDSPYSFSSQTATVDFTRQWSQRFSTDAYVGPQFIGGSDPALASSSVQIAAGANASYQSRTTSYSLAYNRGTNNGSGVIQGSFSQTVSLSAHRMFQRVWSVAASLGYNDSSTLPNFDLYTYSSKGVFASGQVSRGLGRRFSVYADYTVEHQTTGGSGAALNAFTGTFQTVGLGISYSPRPIFLGR